ncbi:hypothetical protein DFH29DRAFT_562458 [Suillus ampliporus]|nr:hypothetical protein DFH29DRAFT_562458 [Suillus ampliporus]
MLSTQVRTSPSARHGKQGRNRGQGFNCTMGPTQNLRTKSRDQACSCQQYLTPNNVRLCCVFDLHRYQRAITGHVIVVLCTLRRFIRSCTDYFVSGFETIVMVEETPIFAGDSESQCDYTATRWGDLKLHVRGTHGNMMRTSPLNTCHQCRVALTSRCRKSDRKRHTSLLRRILLE